MKDLKTFIEAKTYTWDISKDYNQITNFWQKFSNADEFVKDDAINFTYDEIKDKFIKKKETDPDIWIELLLVLNHKVAQWEKKNSNRTKTYKKLLKDADDTITTNFNWDNDAYLRKIHTLNNYNIYKED